MQVRSSTHPHLVLTKSPPNSVTFHCIGSRACRDLCCANHASGYEAQSGQSAQYVRRQFSARFVTRRSKSQASSRFQLRYVYCEVGLLVPWIDPQFDHLSSDSVGESNVSNHLIFLVKANGPITPRHDSEIGQRESTDEIEMEGESKINGIVTSLTKARTLAVMTTRRHIRTVSRTGIDVKPYVCLPHDV